SLPLLLTKGQFQFVKIDLDGFPCRRNASSVRIKIVEFIVGRYLDPDPLSINRLLRLLDQTNDLIGLFFVFDVDNFERPGLYVFWSHRKVCLYLRRNPKDHEILERLDSSIVRTNGRQ
ncbi:MAG: hypothetical protein WAN13_02200, partial [Candidatus Acidiferrales bacterium]